MNTMTVTCGSCAGTGTVIRYNLVSEGLAQGQEETCSQCNGRGYTEHAVFTVDESKVILKHCGLSTES